MNLKRLNFNQLNGWCKLYSEHQSQSTNSQSTIFILSTPARMKINFTIKNKVVKWLKDKIQHSKPVWNICKKEQSFVLSPSGTQQNVQYLVGSCVAECPAMLLCHVPVEAGGREELLGSAYSSVDWMWMWLDDGVEGEESFRIGGCDNNRGWELWGVVDSFRSL